VYLGWAHPVFLASVAFNRINNLRIFSIAFSPIPTALPKLSVFNRLDRQGLCNRNKGFAQGYASIQRSLEASKTYVVILRSARRRSRTNPHHLRKHCVELLAGFRFLGSNDRVAELPLVHSSECGRAHPLGGREINVRQCQLFQSDENLDA
jgi:hypothetical protein